MRVEFEHAVVLGCIHDAGDIAKSKHWGMIVALEPLQPDDRLPNSESLPVHTAYRM
jgi:hypothetical protein